MTYKAERPGVAARLALDEFSADACRFNCSVTSWCKSIAVQQRPFDQISHQTCYLYDQSRSQIASTYQSIITDATFETHELLPYVSQRLDDPGNAL